MLLAGLGLLTSGMILIEKVGGLSDRTERVIALIEEEAINFTTLSGIEYKLPLGDNNCKRAEPPPRRGCLELYEEGDEVLVWYDAANPSHTWEGSTPGGGLATGFLYGGIVLVVIALVTFYMVLLQPRVKAAGTRANELMRRSPRPPH